MQGAFLCVGDMASVYLWLTDCSVCQILRDITTRYKFLRGCRVHFLWDMPSSNAHLWLFCLSDPEGHYNPLQISAWMQSILCVGYAQCLPLIVLSVRSWGTLQPTTNFCVNAEYIFCVGYGQCLPLIDWLFCLLNPEGHYNPLQTSVWMQGAFFVGYTQCLPLIVLSVRSRRTLQPTTKFRHGCRVHYVRDMPSAYLWLTDCSVC